MTPTTRFSANPYYALLERQFVRLHELIAAGEGDGDEADRLREEMEAPYRTLTAGEQKELAAIHAEQDRLRLLFVEMQSAAAPEGGEKQ